MDTQAGDTAEELLQRVDYLDEYLIKSIRFSRYQTRLTLVVVSPPVDESIPTAYRIVFDVVREVLLKNGLSGSMVAEPARMGWVMNELASAEVIQDSPLAAPYADEIPQPFHVALLWHGPTMAHERRIDVVTSGLSIEPVAERSR